LQEQWAASDFVLKWGKCHRNFEMMIVAFGEETVGRTPVHGRISELESGMALSDMSQEWNAHSQKCKNDYPWSW